jgi:hypothetical protein
VSEDFNVFIVSKPLLIDAEGGGSSKEWRIKESSNQRPVNQSNPTQTNP